MIGFVAGRVDTIGPNFCLVEAQGIGYRIFMNAGDLSRLHQEEKVKIYTYLSVREEALQLYGFLTREGYQLFTELISVSGIGPKMAQGILSMAKADAFYLAIKNRDIKYLVKLPGVGKKTAERMLLELKDITGPEEADTDVVAGSFTGMEPSSELGIAAEGLASLGYSQDEISSVLGRLKVESDSKAETLMKQALRLMAGRS